MRCVTLRCRRRDSAPIARHDPLPTTMHPYRDTTGIKGIPSNETQSLTHEVTHESSTNLDCPLRVAGRQRNVTYAARLGQRSVTAGARRMHDIRRLTPSERPSLSANSLDQAPQLRCTEVNCTVTAPLNEE